MLARRVGKKLSENVGQPVVIENRAGRFIGYEFVLRQPPDGYTILIGTIANFGLAPSLYKKMPFDGLRDFTPISRAVVVTNILVVHPSLPVKTAKEFLAFAKARPGQLNYSTSGVGSAAHVASELFALMGGVEFVHVPYKGGGPAVADLVAGHVDFSFATAPSTLALIKAGRLRPLGITTQKRLDGLPDVPTISEAVLPGFDAQNWYVWVTPAPTPKNIVAKLNAELIRAMTSPEVMPGLLKEGMEPTPSTPEELHEFMKSEVAKWADVVKKRHITAE
ncbi:MAG: tripartite tricarboxylate transporter substrate binding protein [Pseudomonadota bacterium]